MSLRTRLILTHIFVIFLTLGIVAVSLIVIFQNYQRQIQLARLGDAAIPLAFQARTLLATDSQPKEIITRLAPAATNIGSLILVSDRGQVLADSTNNGIGRTIPLNPANQTNNARPFFWGSMRNRNGRVLLYAAESIGQSNGQTFYLAVAAP